LSWWFGIPLMLIVVLAVRGWLDMQIGPVSPDAERIVTPYVAASWVCVVLPCVVTIAFFLVTPKSLPPPNEREAAAHRSIQFVYPQAIAVLCGLASFWGVRRWRPIGVIIRSTLGIFLAGFTAYIFAMAAVGMNLWH